MLGTIAFFGQISDDAGPGAWVTASTALIGFIIFGLAIRGYGERDIAKSDKVNLSAALLTIFPWILNNDPLISVILVILIDSLGFIPTIRKSIDKPEEETLVHYFFAGLKFVLALLALDNYTLVTWLYPASLVVANWAFIGLLVLQRKNLKQSGSH